MNSSTQGISPLRQRMIDDMRMRKLAPQDPGRLHPRRAPVRRFPRPLARHRHGRGSAALPAASGRSRHLADHAQRHDHRAEVLLRRHARPQRVDGEDAAGARAAHAAGGVEPRGGRAPDRRAPEPEAPDGAVGRLRRRAARQRGGRAEGRRHRQPAHDAARRAGQGPQGPLRHALAGAARAAARLVARGPCPGQDARRRLAVSRA